MAALTQGRQTDRRGPLVGLFGKGMNASTTIYEGSIVALDVATGLLRPGRVSTTDVIVGCARDTYVNGATAGETKATADIGIFAFASGTAGDAITIADVGQKCYVIDDQTVGKTDGGTTRCVAGRIHDVTSEGVWVAVGLPSSF